jgi:Na+/H+-dicarboxylate symporter
MLYNIVIVLFVLCIIQIMAILYIVFKINKKKISNIILRKNAKIVLFFLYEGQSIESPFLIRTISYDRPVKEVLDEVYSFMMEIGYSKEQLKRGQNET